MSRNIDKNIYRHISRRIPAQYGDIMFVYVFLGEFREFRGHNTQGIQGRNSGGIQGENSGDITLNSGRNSGDITLRNSGDITLNSERPSRRVSPGLCPRRWAKLWYRPRFWPF